MNIASAIRVSRETLGWPVRALAKRANVSPTTISNIENGHSDLTVSVAKRIADAFGIPLDSLIALAINLEKTTDERAQLDVQLRKMALQMLNGVQSSEPLIVCDSIVPEIPALIRKKAPATSARRPAVAKTAPRKKREPEAA